MNTRRKAAQGTAVGYVRVSTVGQADEGSSLEAQRSQIAAYAAMRGLALVDTIEDAGVSAGVPLQERSGGAALLGQLQAKRAGVVIVTRLDRLFRDASDCLSTTAAWDKAGVALHLLDMGGAVVDTSSAMGRMFLTMTAAFAEMERALIGERTRSVMGHMKAQGKRVGTVPYGSQVATDGTTLEPCPAEAAVITQIRALREAGLSLRAIVAELAARGLVSRTGAAFQKTQIVNALKGAA